LLWKVWDSLESAIVQMAEEISGTLLGIARDC
jgi:hypothetical protein